MNKNIEDFEDIKLTYGLIVRGDVDELKKLKRKIEDLDLGMVYQKPSTEKLKIIKEGGENEED